MFTPKKRRIILTVAAAFALASLFSIHLRDNSVISSLQSEISSALDSLGILEGKIATLKSDSTRISNELSLANKKNDYLKESNKKLDAENDSVKVALKAITRKADSYKEKIDLLTWSLEEEKNKRKLAEDIAGQISKDARDDRKFAKAKADTLNKARYFLAPNLAVFIAGRNEPSSLQLYSLLQKYLKPLCEAQVRLVYGPNGRKFRSVANKLHLDYEALYRFSEHRSMDPANLSYKGVKNQLESILNSGDFIRGAEVFGCDSSTASNAQWLAKNIIQIN